VVESCGIVAWTAGVRRGGLEGGVVERAAHDRPHPLSVDVAVVDVGVVAELVVGRPALVADDLRVGAVRVDEAATEEALGAGGDARVGGHDVGAEPVGGLAVRGVVGNPEAERLEVLGPPVVRIPAAGAVDVADLGTAAVDELLAVLEHEVEVGDGPTPRELHTLLVRADGDGLVEVAERGVAVRLEGDGLDDVRARLDVLFPLAEPVVQDGEVGRGHHEVVITEGVDLLLGDGEKIDEVVDGLA
jgi:hypothetical protein